MKKIFILLLSVLPLVAQAQFNEGQWVNHTRYAIASAQNVIDTENKVYYLVNNCIYCFDKATKTQNVLAETVNLSGTLITGIYYNIDKQQLVITYDDSNIDILTNDGNVVNITNVKDAIMTQSKTINDVTFAGSKMYVATGFGYVVIDTDKYQITESKVLNFNVPSVAQVGNKLAIFNSASNILYFPEIGNVPESITTATHASIVTGKIMPINDSTFFVSRSAQLTKYTLQAGNTVKVDTLVAAAPTNVQRTPSGFIANFFAAKYYYTFDQNGGSSTKVSGGQEIFSSYPGGDGSLWSVSASGLHNSAAKTTYYLPEAVSIKMVPWWMGYSKRYHKLYLMATSDNGILGTANVGATFDCNTYDGTSWKSAIPTGTQGSGGWYWPVFDPTDTTDTYYISVRTTAATSCAFKVTDNAVKIVFNGNNCPMVNRKPCLSFDSKGNLWMVHSSLTNSVPVKSLTHEKLQSGSFTSADWTIYQVPDVTRKNSFKYSSFAITKDGSDVKAFCDGDYVQPLIVWRNDSDITNGNFESKTFESLITSDGGTFTWLYAYNMTADDEGYIYFCTRSGLVRFKGSEAFNDDFTVDVNSELNGTTVLAVDFDSQNRKWVATQGDGVYVLSPDCKTTLMHFTSDNSDLSSNVVYNLCCNTDNNSVFIVTPIGIQQYFCDITPAEKDYSDVYAYPNPVRPDFTGYVTICGLMENSTVVIKDQDGNTVKTLTSNGALAIWDCCDAAGNRLPVGNYDVYAAQGSEMPEKPFTTIMVLK